MIDYHVERIENHFTLREHVRRFCRRMKQCNYCLNGWELLVIRAALVFAALSGIAIGIGLMRMFGR